MPPVVFLLFMCSNQHLLVPRITTSAAILVSFAKPFFSLVFSPLDVMQSEHAELISEDAARKLSYTDTIH